MDEREFYKRPESEDNDLNINRHYHDNFSEYTEDPSAPVFEEQVSSKAATGQIPEIAHEADSQPSFKRSPSYSYENYRKQFSVQESTAAGRSKKKKSGKSKTVALIACSLALAMCVGFGGGMLGSYLMSGNNTVTEVKSTNSGKVVTAATTDGKDTDLKIVESSSLEKKSNGTSLKEVVSNVKDSVVEITTESTSYNAFYGQYVLQGAGSGVIISEDGYIITNHHVIEDASNVNVTLTNGNEYEAKVIGSDEKLDIALIKIDAKNLTVATLGSSSDLELGETAIVIGNPLGKLGGSVTAGIISSPSRNITIEGKSMELLQTDAAINPGNSGGGLFDENGNLVGIVVAKSTSTSSGTTVESIGYAIPIDNVKNILGDLKSNGYVSGRAYLGVTLVDVNSDSALSRYNVEKKGVYISSITSDSAAQKAGLTVGDLILKFDGNDVKESSDVSTGVSKKKAGDKVDIVIFRDGEEKTITVTLGEEKSSSSNKNSNNFNNGSNGSNGSGGYGGYGSDDYGNGGGLDDFYDYFMR